MAAGIPGTGVGGVFYALLALLMPVRLLVRRLRGRRIRPGECRAALVQLVLVGGIVAAMGATGLAVSAIADAWGNGAGGGTRTAEIVGAPTAGVTVRATLLATLVSLGIVVVAVQTARLFVRRRRRSVDVAASATRRDAA
jgi:hypothetical protein